MAKSTTRIYKVTGPDKSETLVEATNNATAVRHVVRNKYKVEVADAKDVARLVGAGKKVEQAAEQDDSKKDPAES